MIVKARNNRLILMDSLASNDVNQLILYLQALGDETKKRFAPHSFEREYLLHFFKHPYFAFVASDCETAEIIAYFIFKLGIPEHDRLRLEAYGVKLGEEGDCIFAPSVADGWQGNKVGDNLLKYALPRLKNMGIKRIILWGGVQMDNLQAINYYVKNGFKILGKFSHNGENYDMACEIK